MSTGASKRHQCREDQYKPVTGKTPPDRRAPKLSPKQPIGSSQSDSRGKQGNG